MKAWEDLPVDLRKNAVRPYYDHLKKRTGSLLFKRILDLICAAVLVALLLPLYLVLAILIKIDSRGPVFYRQERITRYGKRFRIFKFRTMVVNADRLGAAVTGRDDPRVTRIGKVLRRLRLDETPQLLNVLSGDMSFVGTRPEVEQYVACYTDEMLATLLLPAGITSEASLRYKDEASLLDTAGDPDKVYVDEILPAKMKWNLQALKEFSLCNEIKLAFRTVAAVLGKDAADQ